MKKFKFRLERLKKLRERVRDQKQIAYAQALEYQGRVQSQIQQVSDFRDQEMANLAEEMQQSSISVERAIQRRTFGSVLSGLDQQLQKQLEQVEHVVTARRDDMVHSEREVRVLEKLEERELQRYQQAVDQEEQKGLDELAVSAAYRQQLLGGQKTE